LANKECLLDPRQRTFSIQLQVDQQNNEHML